MKKKITVPGIMALKGGDKVATMITCYDYTNAKLVDESDIDMILVGDSLGMTMLGYNGTVGVTLEDMIYHTKHVVKGAPNTFVIGDMPFGSYNVSVEDAIRNASRLFAEGGCDCIKLEGGTDFAPVIKAIVKAGIPVCAHIGLTPQSAAMMGGFKVQGKSLQAAQELLDSARAVQEAGAFMVVLEGIPAMLAKAISEKLTIPTMGIGAGASCDMQVLVAQDMLGMNEWVPKFVKKFADLHTTIIGAYNEYVKESNARTFPNEATQYNAKIEGIENLK
ncbi:MAG: 3-methyl-2-oxobutanoate hydroxymethyltransferase [Clostridia bacterium]|jgi:3-methyl-2-oxobutanoate hydroxymethyltransferase|nr:3-methyl-2-oxobutanoate hydroxymethyltransferase [Clostridia bacterium]MCI1999206.1 3-methyl-2-oxobutanoate hydroxymethyltransferase [Clostridia bacterium]MCI2014841.1 3-methyl-2-oxobutanoate hydroxymethyltransferase [Clostridia bacterium]